MHYSRILQLATQATLVCGLTLRPDEAGDSIPSQNSTDWIVTRHDEYSQNTTSSIENSTSSLQATFFNFEEGGFGFIGRSERKDGMRPEIVAVAVQKVMKPFVNMPTNQRVNSVPTIYYAGARISGIIPGTSATWTAGALRQGLTIMFDRLRDQREIQLYMSISSPINQFLNFRIQLVENERSQFAYGRPGSPPSESSKIQIWWYKDQPPAPTEDISKPWFKALKWVTEQGQDENLELGLHRRWRVGDYEVVIQMRDASDTSRSREGLNYEQLYQLMQIIGRNEVNTHFMGQWWPFQGRLEDKGGAPQGEILLISHRPLVNGLEPVGISNGTVIHLNETEKTRVPTQGAVF